MSGIGTTPTIKDELKVERPHFHKVTLVNDGPTTDPDAPRAWAAARPRKSGLATARARRNRCPALPESTIHYQLMACAAERNRKVA